MIFEITKNSKMKYNLVLFFLFPLISFSQSLKNDLFLKQDVMIRGYLTTKDYNLKGNVKKVLNTSYLFNEDGSKNEKGYCDANYFSQQGALIKSETYSTQSPNDKSTNIYYYSSNRLDSTSSPSKKEYKYDNNRLLKRIISYGNYEENKNEIREIEDFFYDSNNRIIKAVNKLANLEEIYEYGKNGEIILFQIINSENNDTTQYEYVYDETANVQTFIIKNRDNKILERTYYKRHKNNRGNPTLIEWVRKNPSDEVQNYGKQIYEYDSLGNSISTTYFTDGKRNNVYESKITYYTEEEKQQEEIIEKEPVISIENILEKQLDGQSISEERYKYTSQDLEITLPEIRKILVLNGFRFLNDMEFETKIKAIFGRKIDPNSGTKYLYANFLEKCDRTYQYFPNNTIDGSGIFIIKYENFITESYAIPQLMDYQKEYQSIAIKEDALETNYKEETGEEVAWYLWKNNKSLKEERKKNIQTLVARNMYLFNDSRAHFKWLILNDVHFMRSLVTTFGYYEDKELVKWVAENTKLDAQDLEPLNEIIYNEKCDRKIGFNYTFFKTIIEDEEKARETFKFMRWYYFYWFLNSKSTLELTFSQRAEVLARMHSFIYSHAKDYRIYEFMGLFAEQYDKDNSYSKEFKAKNYYNIPAFKKQWEEAKLEGDGISLPGEYE